MSDYPDWKPRTFYHKAAPASFVNYANRDWVCITDHKSGDFFDFNLWMLAAQASGAPQAELSLGERVIYLKGDPGEKGKDGEQGPASMVPGPPGPEYVVASRQTVVDKDYNILITDRRIALKGLTTLRTLRLPNASTFPVARELMIFDEDGLCTSPVIARVLAAGTDTISGEPFYDLTARYSFLTLESDGQSKWTVLSRGSVDATSGLVNALIFG